MATSTARLRPSTTLDDRELAKLAIAGDGDAFARLYDRHERRVYGFCLRMLGSPDEAADASQETFMRLLRRLPALEGRDVNFVAYALTAARNACYDTIETRRRVEPVAEQLDRSTTEIGSPIGRHGSEPSEVTLDPERAALLAAAREDVRAANARLPERQREALALRELEQLSYEQIGEIVGLNGNAVAQLISRARIRLREEIRGGALGSIAPSSPDCERALPLLARQQDSQLSGAEEHDWLRTHMDSCDTCRLRRAAMEEAGVSYRALGPIVALAWLRHTTIARAAQLVGADWSHLAGSSPAARPASPRSPETRVRSDGGDGDGSSGYDGGRGVTGGSRRWTRAAGTRTRVDRRLLWPLIGAVVLCALAMFILAGNITGERPVPARRVTTVSSVAPPQELAGAHASGLVRRGRARAKARLAKGHVPALDGAVSAHLPPGVPVPVSHPAMPSRGTGARRRKRHVHRLPARSPSTPAAPPQPAVTTPTTTTAPPSSAPSGESNGGGSTSTTPPPEASGGAGPSGSGSGSGGSPEGGHGCALAIAC